MSASVIKAVFGEAGEMYLPVVFDFEKQLPEIQYEPATQTEIDGVDYAFGSPQSRIDANQMVWRDQMAKAHIAATATILRNARWIRGMMSSYTNSNLMAFGASFRGLIEAAADSFESLRDVPLNLASNFATIRACLAGEAEDKVHVSPELEKLLEHFIYAQKQPKSFRGPSHMKAKHARDYINGLQEADQGKIVDAYADLCEVTHPASLTVTVFLRGNDNGKLALDSCPDERYIKFLIDEYGEIMPRVLRWSLNSAFMTLRVINQLPVPDLHVPLVDSLDFDQSADWLKAKSAMGID